MLTLSVLKRAIILTWPWTLIMKVLSGDGVGLTTDPPLALHVVSLLLSSLEHPVLCRVQESVDTIGGHSTLLGTV